MKITGMPGVTPLMNCIAIDLPGGTIKGTVKVSTGLLEQMTGPRVTFVPTWVVIVMTK